MLCIRLTYTTTKAERICMERSGAIEFQVLDFILKARNQMPKSKGGKWGHGGGREFRDVRMQDGPSRGSTTALSFSKCTSIQMRVYLGCGCGCSFVLTSEAPTLRRLSIRSMERRKDRRSMMVSPRPFLLVSLYVTALVP